MSNSLQKQNQPLPGSFNGNEYIPYNNFYETDDGGLKPRKILSFLKKYKWVVLLFLLGGAVAAWIYADTVTPVYESTGTLLINSGPQSTTDDLSQIISQSTGYNTSSTIENEIQVLRSRKFSEQVATDVLEDKPKNIAQFPIYWHEGEDGEQVHDSQKGIAKKIRNNIGFYKPKDDADVVILSYQSSSPEEAAKIVNLAMKNYIQQSTNQNREAATSTAVFLESQKEKLKGKLKDAEQALQNYMDATGIVQVNEQATNMVSERANTEVQLQQVTLELKAAKESITEYQKQLDDISPGLTDQLTEAVGPRIKSMQETMARYLHERELIIAKNPGVEKRDPLPYRLQYLNKQISHLKGEIKELSAKIFTKDKKFAGINSTDRAQLVSQIQSSLAEQQVQLNQLEARKKALIQNKNTMDAKFNSLPKGMVKLAKLKRDVQINEELYVNVSKKHADMSVLEQSKFGFGRVVDPAYIPNVPISPNKKIFLLLGLMLGGMLAAGYIFVREFRDNSVNSVGQLKTLYLPPLTVIPGIEKATKKDDKIFKKGKAVIPKEVVMLNNGSGITAEAVRRLKNNIIYQNGEYPPKSIVITSPEKGDGKTTVSANLAIAFAEEGYWTLVIDADFRRPKLQKYFGITDELGLGNYLNDEIPFEDILKETDLETLKVINGGRGINVPTLLSNNQKFRKLLKKMEDVFDVIIIDTPPYGIISDPSPLLKYAESTVLVAKYRKTNKGMLLKTIEELKQINANVTNIVLNDFDPHQEVGNYYGDGYYQAMYSNYEQYL